jgi:Uma2 family endonuclease
MDMAAITTGPDQQKHWTAADLRALPDDGKRYEIIDGELFVTPAPSWRHQDISMNLLLVINEYVTVHGIGKLVMAPADVGLSDDTVVEPDLFVVPLVDGRRPRSWDDVGRLLLVVEILSPSTARADRTIKRRRYQREGVPEYWLVDGDARVVERWRPADMRPEIVTDDLKWKPNSEIAALIIDLPVLFATALGS